MQAPVLAPNPANQKQLFFVDRAVSNTTLAGPERLARGGGIGGGGGGRGARSFVAGGRTRQSGRRPLPTRRGHRGHGAALGGGQSGSRRGQGLCRAAAPPGRRCWRSGRRRQERDTTARHVPKLHILGCLLAGCLDVYFWGFCALCNMRAKGLTFWRGRGSS